MGSLVLPTFGEGTQYLRRKTESLLLPEKCTPVPTSADDYEYNRKVYVLLELERPREIINPLPQVDTQSLSRLIELDGSRENNEIDNPNPNPQDIQSIAKDFVGAYDILTPCFNSFGAEHYIVSADIVDGLEVVPANNYRKEGTWQLFEGTRVGLPTAVSLSRTVNKNKNECVCGGPVQTEFFSKFDQLYTANKGGNQNSDISILNARQIPLLVSQDGTYNEELCSTTEENKTTYSYAGVCPAKPTKSPSVSPSASPTDMPTTVSPTESPTDIPTDSPTSFPTDVSPTSSDE